jgi:RNase P subunit RPR2
MNESELDEIRAKIAAKALDGGSCRHCGANDWDTGTAEFRIQGARVKTSEKALVFICRPCGNMRFHATVELRQ